MAKKKIKTKPSKTQVVSFRVTDSLVGKLDDYVERLLGQNPGGNWTRSSAALNLVVLGLESESKA